MNMGEGIHPSIDRDLVDDSRVLKGFWFHRSKLTRYTTTRERLCLPQQQFPWLGAFYLLL